MKPAQRPNGRFCRMAPVPLPRVEKGNLTAARARLAELRFREREELVTPPEKLPSWKWFNPRKTFKRSVTAEFCGDPAPGRSALGGYVQLGDDYCDAGHFECERGVKLKNL